jgi:hypothetical protein
MLALVNNLMMTLTLHFARTSDRIQLAQVSLTHSTVSHTVRMLTIDQKRQDSFFFTPYFQKLLDFLQCLERSVLGLAVNRLTALDLGSLTGQEKTARSASLESEKRMQREERGTGNREAIEAIER